MISFSGRIVAKPPASIKPIHLLKKVSRLVYHLNLQYCQLYS